MGNKIKVRNILEFNDDSNKNILAIYKEEDKLFKIQVTSTNLSFPPIIIELEKAQFDVFADFIGMVAGEWWDEREEEDDEDEDENEDEE